MNRAGNASNPYRTLWFSRKRSIFSERREFGTVKNRWKSLMKKGRE